MLNFNKLLSENTLFFYRQILKNTSKAWGLESRDLGITIHDPGTDITILTVGRRK